MQQHRLCQYFLNVKFVIGKKLNTTYEKMLK